MMVTQRGVLDRRLVGGAAVEERAPSLVPLLLPLVGSLCQTAGVVWLLCRTPLPGTVTWLGLLRLAVVFMLIAMVAHVVAVWLNRRLFGAMVDAPGRLLVIAIWPSVVWVPLLVLLIREQSPWVVVLPSVMAVSAAYALRRWREGDLDPARAVFEAGTISTLFHPCVAPLFLWAMTPAIVASMALHGAVAELGMGALVMAGALVTVLPVLSVWTHPLRLTPFRAHQSLRRSAQAVLPRTLLVLLLILLALVPFTPRSVLSSLVSELLGIPVPRAMSAPPPSVPTRAPGIDYTGVVLTLPARAHEKMLPPAPVDRTAPPGGRSKPIVIPFDGIYWYFKRPDSRPRPDARTVQGDPAKVNIRSTDALPLTMEAHQHLGTPIRMDCCSALRLAISNADDRPGEIYVEVLLGSTTAKGITPQSLGKMVIPSSESARVILGRPPVEETLRFAFPKVHRTQEFDEITVAVQPASGRARTSAHVAVESFELLP